MNRNNYEHKVELEISFPYDNKITAIAIWLDEQCGIFDTDITIKYFRDYTINYNQRNWCWEWDLAGLLSSKSKSSKARLIVHSDDRHMLDLLLLKFTM